MTKQKKKETPPLYYTLSFCSKKNVYNILIQHEFPFHF